MKHIKLIWDDIKKGENIELYATILVSFVISILVILNVNVGFLITPISLSILGILAASALANRHKLDELNKKLGDNHNLMFMDSFPKSFVTELETAQEVWIMGSALRQTIDKHYSLFERMVKRGTVLKFVLINPASHACELAGLKRVPRMEASAYRALVETTLEQICALRKNNPKHKIEVRLTDVPPGFTMYAVNPQNNDGKLYLSYLPFEKYSEYRVKMILLPSSGYPYKAFLQDLLTHWENGKVWECKTTKAIGSQRNPTSRAG